MVVGVVIFFFGVGLCFVSVLLVFVGVDGESANPSERVARCMVTMVVTTCQRIESDRVIVISHSQN